MKRQLSDKEFFAGFDELTAKAVKLYREAHAANVDKSERGFITSMRLVVKMGMASALPETVVALMRYAAKLEDQPRGCTRHACYRCEMEDL